MHTPLWSDLWFWGGLVIAHWTGRLKQFLVIRILNGINRSRQVYCHLWCVLKQLYDSLHEPLRLSDFPVAQVIGKNDAALTESNKMFCSVHNLLPPSMAAAIVLCDGLCCALTCSSNFSGSFSRSVVSFWYCWPSHTHINTQCSVNMALSRSWYYASGNIKKLL